jgi:hypothetical protein
MMDHRHPRRGLGRQRRTIDHAPKTVTTRRSYANVEKHAFAVAGESLLPLPPSDSAAARGRAQHRAAAARPRAGAQDWPPARSLAREGGRRVLSRLSPPHRAFIGRVLRNTRRRLHREGRPYAGGVPARGSQVRRAGSRADACLSRQAIVRAGARSRLCSWQRDLRPRGVASALRRLCAREVD